MDVNGVFDNNPPTFGEPSLVETAMTSAEIQVLLAKVAAGLSAEINQVGHLEPHPLFLDGREARTTGMHHHGWHLVETTEPLGFIPEESDDEKYEVDEAERKTFYLLPHSPRDLDDQGGRLPCLTFNMSDAEFDGRYYNGTASEMRVHTFVFMLLQEVIKRPLPHTSLPAPAH